MKKYKESFYNLVIKKDNESNVLVYNTYSMALCWFDKKTYSSFHNKKDIPEKNLNPEIIRLGFCVMNQFDEPNKVEYEKNIGIFNESPNEVQYIIAPTLKCNVKCKYCFENLLREKEDMSLDVAKQVVDYIISESEKNSNLKRLRIRWFGGEPTLKINIIKYISSKIIDYCSKRQIKYISNIFSNGILLENEIVGILTNECQIHNTQITLDGARETYNSIKQVNYDAFEKVLKNIEDICDRINVTIRINITKLNKEEIIPLCHALLNNEHIKNKIYIYFANVRGYSYNDNLCYFTNEEYEVFKKELYSTLISEGYGDSLKIESLNYRMVIPCSSMQNKSVTIGPMGEIYRCESLLGRDSYVIGDCINGLYKNQIDNQFINFKYPSKCLKCKFLPICAGGCREERLVELWNVDCKSVKKRVLNNVEILLLNLTERG